MKILSIDVGMKNLAYCLFETKENGDNKDNKDMIWSILKWDVVDITNEEKLVCENVEKNNKCNAPAKYCKQNIYYCKKHAKKNDFIIPNPSIDVKKIKKMKLSNLYEFADSNNIDYNKPITKQTLLDLIIKHVDDKYFDHVTPVKCDDLDMITLGRNLKKGFDIIFSCDFIDLTHVIIENQISPIANRMKTLQGMICQYFIMKTNSHIEFISSSNKLKDIDNKNSSYSERKKLGVSETINTLENRNYSNWIDLFKSHKKKDDLADCFLQGTWYLNNKLKN